MNAVLFNFLFIKESNQYIRVISEGWCDTENWSNDAEKSALITEIDSIFKYIKIRNQY